VDAVVTLAEKPTLTGTLVLLRPVRVEDAAGLGATSEESLRFTGTQHRASPGELENWYATRADCDDRLDLSIVERATGEWVGEAVLNELRPDDRSCNFRILLAHPSHFDRGLGTEAATLLLAHAFESVGLHRVELEVLAFNPRARHVYERLGFVHEGTKRESLLLDGEYVDAHTMAMLASEWRARRTADT
jgi:RimJ/RimL family protein N-acetyltransferase